MGIICGWSVGGGQCNGCQIRLGVRYRDPHVQIGVQTGILYRFDVNIRVKMVTIFPARVVSAAIAVWWALSLLCPLGAEGACSRSFVDATVSCGRCCAAARCCSLLVCVKKGGEIRLKHLALSAGELS